MKLTPYANKVSFDNHRSQYQQKAQLAHTQCKLGIPILEQSFLRGFILLSHTNG